MNSPFWQALVLTLTFSFCLCLVDHSGPPQQDQLSKWLIQSMPLDSGRQPLQTAEPPIAPADGPSPLVGNLLDWLFCFLAGGLSVWVFHRFPWSRALTIMAGMIVAFLVLPVLLHATADLLVAGSPPILSIGFGFMTGYVLQGSGSAARDVACPPDPPSSGRMEQEAASSVAARPSTLSTSNPDVTRTALADTAVSNGNDLVPESGRTIGRYEIIRSIGRGAMGEVFLGRDPHINRLTAIKTVHFEETFAAEDIDNIKGKFFREAESAGTLSHPHIVTIYDAGEDGDSAYIAMEFLEGSTLLRFARRQRLLPLRRLIRFMVQVAEALEYAHSQGVIHRDIKPANIMLMQSGQIKITDFGIAHIATSSQTQTGVVKGTPYYMSPEQFSGQKVDGRSDIFSLGTTMFQLLTGTLPFYAESPALLMNQIMNFPHPNPRAINPRIIPAMVAIVDKTLAKDRDHRYQTANELARDLRRLDTRIKTALSKSRRGDL